MQIQPLASHDRPGFDCGRADLDAWLQQVARQHQDKGLSRTYVAAETHAPERICGYYALTLAELQAQHLPPTWRKKLPGRIPGVRMGRLAVSLEHQGRGQGELLIVDTLQRTRRIADEAGGIGLFVDAIDARAAAYYRRLSFASAPDQPLLMFLSAKVF